MSCKQSTLQKVSELVSAWLEVLLDGDLPTGKEEAAKAPELSFSRKGPRDNSSMGFPKS